jgi:hypothetical protein
VARGAFHWYECPSPLICLLEARFQESTGTRRSRRNLYLGSLNQFTKDGIHESTENLEILTTYSVGIDITALLIANILIGADAGLLTAPTVAVLTVSALD